MVVLRGRRWLWSPHRTVALAVLRPAEPRSAAGWEGRERAAGGRRAGRPVAEDPAAGCRPSSVIPLSLPSSPPPVPWTQPTKAKNIARRLLSGIRSC